MSNPPASNQFSHPGREYFRQTSGPRVAKVCQFPEGCPPSGPWWKQLICALGWRTFLFEWYIAANFNLSVLGSYIPIVAVEALICWQSRGKDSGYSKSINRFHLLYLSNVYERWLAKKIPSYSMLDSVLPFLTNIPHVTNVGLTENPTFLMWLMLHSWRIQH